MKVISILKQKRALVLLAISGMLLFGLGAIIFLLPQNSTPPINDVPDLLPNENTTNTNGLKLYRNEEWGFEFQYPVSWALDETYVGGRLRKFHLRCVPSDQKGLFYSIIQPFILDIVTAERAARLTELFYEVKNSASEMDVGGVVGLRYEYEFNKKPRIAIVLPFGEYKLILDSDKEYGVVFAKLTSSFKFINTTQKIDTQNINFSKTYHNGEFNFEFQYPANWLLYENASVGPNSKFNLIGSSPDQDGYPNTIIPSFLLNIVTTDFAEWAKSGMKNLGASISDISIEDVSGKKYEYTEDTPKISIFLPFNNSQIIFSTGKGYEHDFNNILSTFKFLQK